MYSKGNLATYTALKSRVFQESEGFTPVLYAKNNSLENPILWITKTRHMHIK
jgi:hypothetical protein